jgi:P2 family phage contractile tail tube protein
MARRNEEIFQDFNVYIGGMGQKGIANEVTPPAVEMTGVESESSPTGKFEIFYGAVENMELEFTMSADDALVYDEMGKMNNGKVTLKTAKNNGELGQLKKVKIVALGQVSSLSEGTIKRGEKYENKVKMKSLTFYKKWVNGVCVCEIDKINGVCKPDGKTDVLEESRSFVG